MIKRSRCMKAAALLICTALLSSLCGCHDHFIEPDENMPNIEIRFSWWGSDELNKCTLDGLSKFSEDRKITVIPQYEEFNGFKSKMDTQIYSDTAPDVMQLNYDWLYQYTSEGQEFYDLSKFNEIDLGTYSQSSLACGMIDGKLQAIPYGMNALSFLYNKTLYDDYGFKLPSKWDDLFEYAKKMRRDLVYPIALTDKNFWFVSCAYLEQTTGHSVFGDDGQIALTKEDIEIMLGFDMELLTNRVCPPPLEYDRREFSMLRYAGVASFSSDSGYFEDAANEMNMQLSAGPYPTTVYYKRYGWYIKPTGLYAVSRNSKHPHEAAELLDYLINSSDMSASLGMSKGVPVSTAAEESLEARGALSGIEFETHKQLMNEPRMMTMNPYMESDELVEIYTDAINAVYYNLETTNKPEEESRVNVKNKQTISQAAIKVYDKMSKMEF